MCTPAALKDANFKDDELDQAQVYCELLNDYKGDGDCLDVEVFRELYLGEYSSCADFAQELVENTDGLSFFKDIPEWISRYVRIDYDAMWEQALVQDYSSRCDYFFRHPDQYTHTH